jgi:hypothetical protein
VGLRERLERLEAVSGKAESPKRSRAWERYLHVHENGRREIQGLEPLPDLPYTEEDRADDRETLEETIPRYRMSPGYQSGDGKAFLDQWERSIRDKLAKAKLKGAQNDV